MFKFITLTGCCLLSCAVFADESVLELETVTVKGQKSNSPLRDNKVLTKTEINQQQIPEQGLNRVQDLSKNIPNFTLTDQSLGSFRQVLNMRGLVNTAIYGAPAVVFYVDDVAYSTAMTNMGLLFDVDKVNVYRGAQPGQFGKNAYAGAVTIQTQQPENALKGGMSFEVGTYDRYQVSAKVSGALINDKLFFNLGGVYERSKGFLTNTFLNNHPDGQENFSGRAALTWKPSEAWDIRFTLTKEDFDYGNARFVRLSEPKSFSTRANLLEELKQNSDSQALRIAYQTDDYKILSVTSRRFWNMKPLLVDLDLNPVPAAMRNLNLENETWTQEVRINPKNSGDWDWHLGGFYSTHRYYENDDLNVPGSHDLYSNTIQTDNYALFGKLSYQGIKNLSLYNELRIDYVHSHVNGILQPVIPVEATIGLTGNYDTVFASPKWGLTYRFSDNGLVYASTGFGFKPGGFTYANRDDRAERYKQEFLWHNTVGIKTNWFNERWKSNLAGFYYKIKDYQIERFFAGGNYGLFNAAKVSSYGFEFENQIQLLDELSLQNSVGYTHSRFDSYYDAQDQIDYTGNPVPFVPAFSISTALEYKHPQGYFGRFEWLWKGKTYFDETRSKTLSQSDYALLNLRLGFSKNGYSAYLFANNLTNNYYYTTKLGVRGAPSDPRTLGIRLGIDF
jgi:iron complex outermembrane recepter protein